MATKAKARTRGHVRQRGSSWVVKYRAEGRQVWRSFKTREEAELELARITPQLIRGEVRAPVRAMFEDAANGWLEHGRDRGLAPSTLRDRRSVLDHWLIPAFEGRTVQDITAASITKWRREQMRAVEKVRGEERPCMSRRTAAKVTSLLFSIFEYARTEYGLASNPVERVERITVAYDPDRFEHYEPEEVRALARAAADDQDAAIYLTAAFAGLRRGECLALRWRDVDFARQALRVQHSVTLGREVKGTKSGRSRSVPMVPELAGALDRLSRRDGFVGQDDFVFVASDGGPIDGSALRRRYVQAQKRAGLKPIRFHDLRHSFGTTAANAARSGHELQHWMGHADYRTTTRYLHYRERGDEANRLAAAFTTVTVDDLLRDEVEDGRGRALAATELQPNTLREPAAAFHRMHPTEH